jgi:hypothetical protein
MTEVQATLYKQLTSLLRDAGSTHHKAFIATNGDDPEWPIWYAEFLQPKLNALLSAQWTKSEIVYLLLHAEKQRAAQKPGSSWPEFYAQVFLNEK